MADMKWIKLDVSIFEDEKIMFIKTLPGGNDILMFWIQLLTLAGKTNSGGYIVLTKRIPYTEQMLADKFHVSQTVVHLALKTFFELEMIEYEENGAIFIANWKKHQNVDGMERVREQNRMRKQRQREKDRQIMLMSGDMSRDSHGTSQQDSHVTVTGQVTQNHAIELELELEQEKEQEKDIKHIVPPKAGGRGAHITEIVSYLNQQAGKNYSATAKATRGYIIDRHKEGFTLDDFKTVIDKKVRDWKGTEYEKFLRPETLFAGKHFDSYLNEPEVTQRGKRKADDGKHGEGHAGRTRAELDSLSF